VRNILVARHVHDRCQLFKSGFVGHFGQFAHGVAHGFVYILRSQSRRKLAIEHDIPLPLGLRHITVLLGSQRGLCMVTRVDD